jgi:hypothetical protein
LPVVDTVVFANGTLKALAVAEVVMVAFVELVAVVAVAELPVQEPDEPVVF